MLLPVLRCCGLLLGVVGVGRPAPSLAVCPVGAAPHVSLSAGCFLLWSRRSLALRGGGPCGCCPPPFLVGTCCWPWRKRVVGCLSWPGSCGCGVRLYWAVGRWRLSGVLPRQSLQITLWVLFPATPCGGTLRALVGWVVPRHSQWSILRRTALCLLFPPIPGPGMLLAFVGWMVRRPLLGGLPLPVVDGGPSPFLGEARVDVAPCPCLLWASAGCGGGWWSCAPPRLWALWVLFPTFPCLLAAFGGGRGGPSPCAAAGPVDAVPRPSWLRPVAGRGGAEWLVAFRGQGPVGVVTSSTGLLAAAGCGGRWSFAFSVWVSCGCCSPPFWLGSGASFCGLGGTLSTLAMGTVPASPR